MNKMNLKKMLAFWKVQQAPMPRIGLLETKRKKKISGAKIKSNL